MKVRVKSAPPVAPQHGITTGREFDVVRRQEGRGGGVFVRGDAGEDVLLLTRQGEYEVTDNGPVEGE